MPMCSCYGNQIIHIQSALQKSQKCKNVCKKKKKGNILLSREDLELNITGMFIKRCVRAEDSIAVSVKCAVLHLHVLR